MQSRNTPNRPYGTGRQLCRFLLSSGLGVLHLETSRSKDTSTISIKSRETLMLIATKFGLAHDRLRSHYGSSVPELALRVGY